VLNDLMTVKFILLIFLFLLSAFFSGSEAAFFSLTPLHLHKMREERYPFLPYVQALLKFPRRLLITILVGNEAVNITISAVAASLFIFLLGANGQWVTILVTTPLLLVFGEAVPKTFAVTHPMRFAAFLSPFLLTFARLGRPVVWVLDRISGFIVSLFPGSLRSRRAVLMEEEFKILIDAGEQEGALEPAQRDLIHKVFELGDTTVAEVMIPRVDMFCLPLSMRREDMEKEIVRARHERIPVYGADRDDIVGILYARDLLEDIAGRQKPVSVEKMLRRPYFVPEEKTAGSMLRDFQDRHAQMAIVVDEYGGVSGLITLEDILENLFENIYDQSGARKALWQKIDENTWMASGKMPMEDLIELVTLPEPDNNFETLGGFVFHLFGRLPLRGESVAYGGFVFRVEKMGRARILRVRIQREPDRG
jgi:putative hemolysin